MDFESKFESSSSNYEDLHVNDKTRKSKTDASHFGSTAKSKAKRVAKHSDEEPSVFEMV